MKTTLEQAWPRPSREHVDRAVQRLVREFKPRRILVFGSYARGEARHGSDLDLLVVLDHVENRREAAVQMRRLLAGLHVPFDVFVTTPDEIVRRGWIVGTLLCHALQEGQEVYQNGDPDE